MATVTTADGRTGQLPAMFLYRFTVARYHRMIETRVLTEKDRVELLEGLVVPKMPHNPPRDGTVTRMYRRLLRILPEDWLIRVQCATTTRDSEPEPDLAIVRGPEEIYFSRHPQPQDIAFLVEVADATLEADRRLKGALYARARIRIYWVVNLPESRIEVYTQPRAGKTPGYRQRRDHLPEEMIPVIVEDREVGQVAVRDLLPRVSIRRDRHSEPARKARTGRRVHWRAAWGHSRSAVGGRRRLKLEFGHRLQVRQLHLKPHAGCLRHAAAPRREPKACERVFRVVAGGRFPAIHLELRWQ